MLKKPLAGKTVLVTRSKDQAAAFSEFLRARGAETITVAAIELQPLEEYSALSSALRQQPAHDWIVVTSANAVNFFIAQAKKVGVAPEELGAVRFAAIGPATAERLEHFGLKVELAAKDSRAEGLVEALKSYHGPATLAGQRILLPRALEAREILPDELRRLGAIVDDVPIYRTVAPHIDLGAIEKRLQGKPLDVAAFTSSSAVRHLLSTAEAEGRPDFLRGVLIAAIGPVTAATLVRHALSVDIVPAQYTMIELARAIANFLTPKPAR